METLIVLFTAITVMLISMIVMQLFFGPVRKDGQFKRMIIHLRGGHEQNWTMSALFLRLLPQQWRDARYHFSTRTYLLYTIPVYVFIAAFVWFFFRSWLLASIVAFIAFSVPQYVLLRTINQNRERLNRQLREAMFSLIASLRAGASLQNALERSVIDLQRLFQNEPDAPIVQEFQRMNEMLRTGMPIQEVLIAFRDRVQLEDVDDFVNAALIAKARGGNLTEILSRIAQTIGDKIETQQEIKVLTAGKRMEATLMSVMPIAIVLLLTIFSPDYMAPMYESWIGRILLFIGFVLIGLNVLISRRIVRIDI